MFTFNIDININFNKNRNKNYEPSAPPLYDDSVYIND